jgi:N-acyl-phosphatidylethanolamine-hydrolysing phospholipase D
MRAWRFVGFVLLALSSCIVPPGRFFSPLFESPREVPNKITHPVRDDVHLSVLWVGHATALIEIDDKVVLTDPVFTGSVGQTSKRLVEPGLDVENVPTVDAVVISHLHFDHLSLGSLELLQDRIRTLILPKDGLVYLTDFQFPALELDRWQHWEKDGLRITAVPVIHNGMRYGLDIGWMKRSFCGYVIQYHGVTVYFGGDSAYGPHYRETAKRFPKIDLALLPISPIEPRGFMKKSHVDPEEAVRAYLDLGARWMVPVHYGTFVNGQDLPGDVLRALGAAMRKHGLGKDRVAVLAIGEQRIFLRRDKSSDASQNRR